MDKQLANEFFEEAYKAFAFLVKEHKFAPPRLEVDDSIDFAFVIFMGKNLAVECILDEREADIDCKVARVVGGKRTDHYSTGEGGERVREGLATLLRRRGVKDQLFQRVGGLVVRERVKVTLADFAHMLQKYGQDILADSPTALA